MKKITLFLVVLTILYSCSKDEDKNNVPGTVCATCIEQKSGYQPQDYCSTPAAVDAYISTLKKEGAKNGQIWNCTKH
ncbi:MAG TPA: hypothetical protein PKN44_10100 [Bacteroidales bacterium]|nr:hypothetical protein [Bacteroidales bacterium]